MLTATAEGERADLSMASRSSYGTLGYALSLTID